MRTTSWLTLEPDDILDADQLALDRQAANVKADRPAAWGAPTDWKAGFALHRQGTRHEKAGHLYLMPCRWNRLLIKVAGKADYEDWIDAKGIRKRTHCLLLHRDANPRWAYLLICGAQHPRYEIIGWIWGEEGMQAKYLTDKGNGRPEAFFIPADDPLLRNPETLYDALRRRQGR